jgi:hypothetical protein
LFLSALGANGLLNGLSEDADDDDEDDENEDRGGLPHAALPPLPPPPPEKGGSLAVSLEVQDEELLLMKLNMSSMVTGGRGERVGKELNEK